MDKKEKYYNFIVNDLIKKTVLDYDLHTIKYPWGGLSSTMFRISIDMYFFNSFIIDRYGVKREEVQMIKDFYLGKLHYTIKEHVRTKYDIS